MKWKVEMERRNSEVSWRKQSGTIIKVASHFENNWEKGV
jgi:hypothetical protein